VAFGGIPILQIEVTADADGDLYDGEGAPIGGL
jgi:hypothetical protein